MRNIICAILASIILCSCASKPKLPPPPLSPVPVDSVAKPLKRATSAVLTASALATAQNANKDLLEALEQAQQELQDTAVALNHLETAYRTALQQRSQYWNTILKMSEEAQKQEERVAKLKQKLESAVQMRNKLLLVFGAAIAAFVVIFLAPIVFRFIRPL